MAAGDDSSVPLAAPTGTADVRLTANGDQRQVVAVGNAGDRVAGVTPWGALETFTGMSTLFYDAWSTTLDTTDKWTVTGTAPTISGGNMTFPTTAGYHAIRSKDTVRPNAGFTLIRNGIWLEAAAGTGSTRFWGLATPATTPSATVMAQDGVGFEVDQAGALSAVVYSAGVKTSTTALTRPADGAVHAYEVVFRVTGVTWHIDNFQVAATSVTFPTVTVVELPALLARFNVGTPSGVTYTNIAHLTGDTSRQGMSIMDPTIGTRQAKVSSAGALLVEPYETPALTMGSGTGQTPATAGQVGRMVRATANVAQATAANLINAPAAGTRIYVTNIMANNEGATLTTARLFAGSLPAAAGAVAYTNDVVDMSLAASGGGAVINFPPGAPWALPVATALSYAVTAATTWSISITYYVA